MAPRGAIAPTILAALLAGLVLVTAGCTDQVGSRDVTAIYDHLYCPCESGEHVNSCGDCVVAVETQKEILFLAKQGFTRDEILYHYARLHGEAIVLTGDGVISSIARKAAAAVAAAFGGVVLYAATRFWVFPIDLEAYLLQHSADRAREGSKDIDTLDGDIDENSRKWFRC